MDALDRVKKYNTPLEELVNKNYDERLKIAKMDKDLAKFGRKDASGGMVWTVSDMQRFFNRKK